VTAGDPAYKRPESVLVVVHTRDGEFLLLQRREPAQFWQSVTGSLNWDERNPAHAARRELREETGIEAGPDLRDWGRTHRFPILPAWRARYAPGVTCNVEHVFSLLLPAPVPVVLNPDEHVAWRWLPAAAAAALASSETNRAVILALGAGD